MIIAGELINASRKSICAAIETKDSAAIQAVAKDQREAGADFIDVNAGIFVGQEAEYLKWLITHAASTAQIPRP
jgi:5-methyltetrahydrofolate--homocysteine methyltransferase